MSIVLIMVLALQAQINAQDQAQINAQDVVDIVDATLASVANEDRVVGGLANRDRELFLDVEATTQAFASVTDSLPRSLADLRRTHSARRQSVAVPCGPPSGPTQFRRCEVANDGIFVSISRVARVENPSEILVNVLILRNSTDPAGRQRIGSGQYELFVAKVDGRWTIVRHGVARVS